MSVLDTALINAAEGLFADAATALSGVSRALVYADAAHRAVGQRRKYTGNPYIEHPRMVAGLILLSPQADISPRVHALQAALLHDVVEDTEVTLDDLRVYFDEDVVTLVDELSERDSYGHWFAQGMSRPNRATRRAIEAERRSTISPVAQTISCADIIANSHDIADVADKTYALMYQRELLDRLGKMTRAGPTLRDLARDVLETNIANLEGEIT